MVVVLVLAVYIDYVGEFMETLIKFVRNLLLFGIPGYLIYGYKGLLIGICMFCALSFYMDMN